MSKGPGDLQKSVRGAAGQDQRRWGVGVGVARQLGDVVGGYESIQGAGGTGRDGLNKLSNYKQRLFPKQSQNTFWADLSPVVTRHAKSSEQSFH